jgi:hypothetical protein
MREAAPNPCSTAAHKAPKWRQFAIRLTAPNLRQFRGLPLLATAGADCTGLRGGGQSIRTPDTFSGKFPRENKGLVFEIYDRDKLGKKQQKSLAVKI